MCRLCLLLLLSLALTACREGKKPTATSDPPVVPKTGDGVGALGVPVDKALADHLERLTTCFVGHQESAGRRVQLRPWKRMGGSLERTVLTTPNKEPLVSATVGTRFIPGKAAEGHFLRVRYHHGRKELMTLYCEAKGKHGSAKLTATADNRQKVTLVAPWAAVASNLSDEEELQKGFLATVTQTHQRKLRGIHERQVCEVLPNGGQSCEKVKATPVQMEKSRKLLDREREESVRWIQANVATLLKTALELYPITRTECNGPLP